MREEERGEGLRRVLFLRIIRIGDEDEDVRVRAGVLVDWVGPSGLGKGGKAEGRVPDRHMDARGDLPTSGVCTWRMWQA